MISVRDGYAILLKGVRHPRILSGRHQEASQMIEVGLDAISYCWASEQPYLDPERAY